jgi:steroid delta-isomerase-like uncharacterized protein
MLQLDPENLATLATHVNAETVFDMEATLATLTHDCVFEDVPTNTRYEGHEGVRRYYQEWWSAFKNIPGHSRRYVPSGRQLIVETRFLGSHCGVFLGIAASNRPIDLPVAIFVNFRDGLMSGERFYYDRTTLLAQITPS